MTVKSFIRHPVASLDGWWEEASPKRRIDANFGNIFMLIALMLPSLSIMLRGPALVSPITQMPTDLQSEMCACIFFGCGMKLHGALSGRRFWFPHTRLKRCYTYGFSGAPIAFVGCSTYGYFIMGHVPDFWALMTGVATPCFGVGIMAQAVLYVLEYRRIDRNERQLRIIELDRK